MVGRMRFAISGLMRCWTFNFTLLMPLLTIRSNSEMSILYCFASLYTLVVGRSC